MESVFGNITDALFPVALFSSNPSLSSRANEPIEAYGNRGVSPLTSVEDISAPAMSALQAGVSLPELSSLLEDSISAYSVADDTAFVSRASGDDQSDFDESSSDDGRDYDDSDLDSETELDRAANEIVRNGSFEADTPTASMAFNDSSERPRRQRTQSLPIAAVETVEPSGSRKRASVGEESASSGKKLKRALAKQGSKRQGAATATEGKGRKGQMDKRELKKLKNREAAARCRNRRKQLIDDLTAETNKLKREMAKLQDQVDKLNGENKNLQRKLLTSKATCVSCHRNVAARNETLNQYMAINQLQYGPAVSFLDTQSTEHLEYLLGSNMKLPFYQPTEELASFMQV